MISFRPILVLILVLFLIATLAQRPVIRVGRTSSRAGALQQYAYGQETVYNFWQNWTNTEYGGVNVNGTVYDVNVVTWNDASDADLILPLYRELLMYGNVNAFLSPFNSVLTLNAEKFLNSSGSSIPMVLAGGGALNLFGFPHAFGTVPGLGSVMTSCLQSLGSAGGAVPKTIFIVYQAGDFFQQTVSNSIIAQGPTYNLTILGNLSFTAGNNDWSSHIAQIKSLNPDILVGCMYQVDIASFLEAIKLAGIYPKATVFSGTQSVGISIPLLAKKGLTWTIDQVFSIGWWEANQTSQGSFGFKNSSVWSKAIQAATNYTPADIDASAFIAGMVLTNAFERAGTLDPDAVTAAIRTTNFDSFYGHISFDSKGQIQLPWHCQQYKGLQASVVAPADQKEADAVYPATTRAPPHFYDLPVHKKSHTLRNALIITFSILAFALLVALAVFLFFKYRYHFILIAKEEIQGEEWGGGN